LKGQWFSPDLETALVYLRKSQQTFGTDTKRVEGVNLVVVKIPKEEFENLHVSKHPIASQMDVENDNYIVPENKERNYINLDDVQDKVGNFENLQKAGMEKIVIIANEIEGDALYSLALTNKEKMAKGEGMYILGIFLVYILIGLGILQALHLFNTPHFMAKVGAFLLIALGVINLINEFFPNFPIKLRIPSAAHHKMAELMDKGSIPAAFLLGILVGLCEFPCTGGPYLMVLGLLHDQSTYFTGLGYLFLYNLIFVLPLVVILLIASDKILLTQVQAWQQKEWRLMRFGGGIAMVVLGSIILLF